MSKQTILAFVLIALIFVFYDDYIRWVSPPQPESADSTRVSSDPIKPPTSRYERSGDPYLTSADKSAPETPLADSPEPFDRSTFFESAEPPEPSPEEMIITVNTDMFIARFSSHGAVLTSFRLKPNGKYLKKNIELLNKGDFRRPSFGFWTYEGQLQTADLQFSVVGFEDYFEGNISVTGGASRRLEFRTQLDSQRSLSIVYTFLGDGLTFLCEVEGEGLRETWVRDYADVSWHGGLAYTEPDTVQDLTFSRAFAYFTGDALEDIKVNKKKDELKGPFSGDTKWTAIRTKYFLAALITELNPARESWLESKVDRDNETSAPPNLLGMGMQLPLENGLPNTPIRIFLGPLDDDLLMQVDPTLKKTMNWGWPIIAPFSKLILWSLKALHGFIPNYGICLIIFSVLIKIVLWPLTRKSYQSMAAMQRLQPRIKELRDKYKNDQQRVQKEMMKLYKEEKVNPMGGCLPILLQMPLLFALFNIFRSTIELRRAPFMLWINDLSMPDVLFQLPFTVPMYGSHLALLPIVMGISTFYQSKSTMTDPNQKMMLYFMPIFMVLIFNNLPSGLTLYYTLFNVWTLIQQKITPPPKGATAEVKSK